MININVKNIQDGKIVSNVKEVIGVYVTFVRHDEANELIENYDLQQRLHPLAEIESDNEIISGSFDDTLENIQLQEYLLGERVDVLSLNIKPNKIVQVWAFVGDNLRQIFSLISSCFGSGTWMSSEKWSDTDLWKY